MVWRVDRGIASLDVARFAQDFERQEVETEVLDPFDEAGELRLIRDLADQHGRAVAAFEAHAVEEDGKAVAQLPSERDPVGPAMLGRAAHRRQSDTDQEP